MWLMNLWVGLLKFFTWCFSTGQPFSACKEDEREGRRRWEEEEEENGRDGGRSLQGISHQKTNNCRERPT